MKHWLWTTTTVIDQDPSSNPTDLGHLDPEDLGAEVVKALAAPTAPQQEDPGNDPSLLFSDPALLL